ncbi:MAG TPA: hypothetical protein VGM37_14920 [Armatimonadota bacterium]|jgi:hypothetical protein
MRLVPNIAAGAWILAVGLQGLAHLAKYGMLPILPDGFARVDFTPAYPALAALLAAGAIIRALESRRQGAGR